MRTATKTLQATLAPPTAHKERKLQDTLGEYRSALSEAFDSGADTMNGVSEVVTPYDLPYQAKAALCSYVPKLRKTYNPRGVEANPKTYYAPYTYLINNARNRTSRLEPASVFSSPAMSIESPPETDGSEATGVQSTDQTATDTDPEYAIEATDPDYPRTDTDPKSDGSDDPLPNRGISDITFGDLDDDHTDAATLYDRIITHNGYTCSNCFARLGRQWELPNEKVVEDLAALTTYVRREIPYQIPEDKRDRLDDRFYQSETFGDRAGFIPASGKHQPTKRILICYNCGHQLTPSSGPSTFGIYRGCTLPDGISYTPARAWRYDDADDDAGGDSSRTRDNPRTKSEAVHAALTLSHTLAEYGIAHDAHVLAESVRAQKSIVGTAANDDDIFRRAMAAGVTAHRTFETTPLPRPR